MGKRSHRNNLFIFGLLFFYFINIFPINFGSQIIQQSQNESALLANDNQKEIKEKTISNINNQLNQAKDNEIQEDIFVKYKNYEELIKIKDDLNEKGINIKESYQLKDELKDGYQRGVIRVRNKAKVKETVKYLNSLSNIAYAEPNYKYTMAFTPTDEDYKYQWSLDLMDAPLAWDISKGSSSITVAVLDTGIDFKHPEFSNHISGYGYDFVNNDKYPGDDNGHGTMVSGVVGAKIDGKGIVGIANGVRILPIKVLDRYGSGYTQNISKGIIYAVNKGAKIINLSLAGPFYSQGVSDAIEYAHNKGTVVIAASGNSGKNIVTYPAAYPYVIAVGSTDADDIVSSFSNYGSYIDVSAPGEEIYTTAPIYKTYLNQKNYAIVDGTSFAAPQVSGLAALVLSVFPKLTPAQVEGMIEGGVKDLGTKGKDRYYGYGRIDIYRTLVDNYEPNYNLEHGVIVPSGQSSHANLVPAWDYDYYKYYIKKGYKFSFSVTPPTGADIVIRVFNNQGKIVKTINRGGDSKSETDSVIQTEDGYLYLQIYDFKGRIIRTNYVLKTSKQDIYENNNTKDSAYYINKLPIKFNAQLSGKNDFDWYKVVVTRGGELKVDLSNYTKASGWQVSLYNKDNILMPRLEGGTTFSGLSTFKLDNGGTYYIKLYNNNGEDIIKDYTLNINYNEKDIYEPNDNINSVVSNSILEIKWNLPLVGNFHTKGDLDYYYISPTEAGVFSYNLQFPLGMQPDIIIYRAEDLTTPIYSSFIYNENISDQVRIDQAGRYVVLIKPLNNYYTSSGNYIFEGNFTTN